MPVVTDPQTGLKIRAFADFRAQQSPLETIVLEPLRRAAGPYVTVTATRMFAQMVTVITMSQPDHVVMQPPRTTLSWDLDTIVRDYVQYDRVPAKQLSYAITDEMVWRAPSMEGVYREVANYIWGLWTSGTSATSNNFFINGPTIGVDPTFFTSATTAATFNLEAIWGNWNFLPTQYGQQPALTRTEAEVEAAVRRQAEWTARQQEEQARRAQEQAERAEKAKAAKERAAALLASLLNEEQRRELREKNLFHVKSQLGRTYRIQRGRAGNILLLDDRGRPEVRYCIHSTMWEIPEEDEMVGQMLMLQGAEADFRRIANATRLQVN